MIATINASGLQPLIVGHETAGTAVTVGPKVKFIKVGDRVGVGKCHNLRCSSPD